MARHLDVRLHGQLAGTLTQTDGGQLTFAYRADWCAASGAPLSLSLPLRPEPFSHRESEPFFGGLLPEEGTREQVARYLGITARNDFALLEQIGGECAGAVSLHPAGETLPAPPADSEEPEALSDAELVLLLDNLPQRPLLVGGELRLSLAGAQDKAAVNLAGGRVALPVAGEPTTHILKTPIQRFEDTVLNELICLRAAARWGLPTAGAERREVQGREYLLVERFDRERSNGRLRRLHQEDFCQALGHPTRIKYQSEGGPGTDDCFGLLTRVARRPAVDRLTLMRATFFNVLLGNADAHAKNFSLLHETAGTRLAPLYDLLSTRLYPDLSPRYAMKIGRQAEFESIGAEQWELFAQGAGLAPAQVRRALDLACDELPGALQATVDELEPPLASRPVVSRLLEETQERCRLARP